MNEIPILRPSPTAIRQATEQLAAGRLVVFPTETVYGLGGDATNGAAVQAIFDAKGRPAHNPLICHIAEAAQLNDIARVSDKSKALAAKFWPGPLTMVLNKSAACPVDDRATAGLDTIAVRIPAHDTALSVLSAFGRPLVAPSANTSGRVSPTQAQHVQLTDESRISMILDGGPCRIGLESTILSLTGPTPRLLRPGAITAEEIETVIGPVTECRDSADRPTAPGQLESHYAPQKPVRLAASSPNEGEAFLAFGPYDTETAAPTLNLSETGDLAEAASHLYAYLQALDAMDCDGIAVAPIPDKGIGKALNDRLTRAAAPRGRTA